MDFIALDFETANATRGSVCEIGVAIVQSGEVTETFSRLVRPRKNWFHPMNTQIHGIDALRVAEEPEFDTIWHEVQSIFDSNNVVAHNASFDISVLRHVLTEYELPFPSFNYTCSLMVARRAWQDLGGYGLSALSQRFNIRLKHHSAESDAEACARILLKAAEEHGLSCFEDIEEHLEIQIGRVYPGGYLPSGKLKSCGAKAKKQELKVDLSKVDKNHPLFGKYIVFTGALKSMKRQEAQVALLEVGGYYTNNVTYQTNFMVLGEKSFKNFSEGIKSNKLIQAERLSSAKRPIEFLSEQQFLKLLRQERD